MREKAEKEYTGLRKAKTEAGRLRSEVIKLNYYQSLGCNKIAFLTKKRGKRAGKGGENEKETVLERT